MDAARLTPAAGQRTEGQEPGETPHDQVPLPTLTVSKTKPRSWGHTHGEASRHLVNLLREKGRLKQLTSKVTQRRAHRAPQGGRVGF